MKMTLKKGLSLMMVAIILGTSVVAFTACASSEKTMYERKQSNKPTKVKSNIKVKSSNRTSGYTTRSY